MTKNEKPDSKPNLSERGETLKKKLAPLSYLEMVDYIINNAYSDENTPIIPNEILKKVDNGNPQELIYKRESKNDEKQTFTIFKEEDAKTGHVNYIAKYKTI